MTKRRATAAQRFEAESKTRHQRGRRRLRAWMIVFVVFATLSTVFVTSPASAAPSAAAAQSTQWDFGFEVERRSSVSAQVFFDFGGSDNQWWKVDVNGQFEQFVENGTTNIYVFGLRPDAAEVFTFYPINNSSVQLASPAVQILAGTGVAQPTPTPWPTPAPTLTPTPWPTSTPTPSPTPAPAADDVAPARVKWASSGANEVGSDSITFRWKAAVDNVGTVRYQAQLQNEARQAIETVDIGDVREYTFDGLAPGRYAFYVRGIDAAGNVGPWWGLWHRVLSPAEQVQVHADAQLIVDAIEAFVGDGGELNEIGGANGQGWFNYRNGTSYPARMADVLVDGGYLDARFKSVKYWDYMVYRCGSGDTARSAVFAYTTGDTTDPVDAANWQGCTQSPTRLYGHHHIVTTGTKAEIVAAAAVEAPPTPVIAEDGIVYNPNVTANWTVAWADSGDEYEFFWLQDGVAITQTGLSHEPNTEQLVVASGYLCFEVRALRSGVYSEPAQTCRGVNPIPEIDFVVGAPVSTSIGNSPADTLRVSWDQLPDWDEIRGIEVWTNGQLVETLDSQSTVYLVTGLTPNTLHEIEVYPIGWWPFPEPDRDHVVVGRTQIGTEPPAEPVFDAWASSSTSVTLWWGYTGVEADDTGIASYQVTVDEQPVPVSIPADARSYSVGGLFPSTEVVVRVTAFDEDGNATSSRPVTVRTDPSPPPPSAAPTPAPDTTAPVWGGSVPKQIQSVDVVQPGAVELRWCCALDIDPSHGNLVPASFDLFLKRASEPASAYQLVRNIPATNTSATTTLTGLVENAEYSVLVVAIDWVGNRSVGLERSGVIPRGAPIGPEPEPIEGAAVADPAPQAPPAQPQETHTTAEEPVFEILLAPPVKESATQPWNCSATTFTAVGRQNSLQVTWSGGLTNHDSYAVTATRVGRLLPTASTVDQSSPVNLLGLEFSTDYNIKVYARNSVGVSLGACSFAARTLAPPSQPDITFGEPESPDCIRTDGSPTSQVKLSWDSFVDSDEDWYRLRRFRFDDGGGDTEVDEFIVRGGTNWTWFDLDQGYRYTVLLDVITDNGPGSWRHACEIRFTSGSASFREMDGAWGFCGNGSAALLIGVEAGVCSFINDIGQVRVLAGGQLSAGIQAGGSGSGLLARADTGNLGELDGVSLCYEASVGLVVGAKVASCTGIPSGPTVMYGGLTTGGEFAGAGGISGSFFIPFEGNSANLKTNICITADSLGITGPAFCQEIN